MEIIENGVIVEWVNLNEGYSGDYDPNDPEDINLLRFDVSRIVDGKREEVLDASYCTLFPADAPCEQRCRALAIIMREVGPEVRSGHSIKRLCEKLSWISPETMDDF